ncbi:MAG TPA: phosphatidate cytidylyltransferase [Oculatellaceae cyanobacterium]
MTSASSSAGNPMLSRVGVGIIVAVVFFGSALLGGWWWALLVFVSMILGQQELCALMKNLGIRPSLTIIYASAVAMALFAALDKPQFLPTVLTLTMIACFFRLLFRSPRAGISDIGGTLLAVFYMVYLPVQYILLRQLNTVPDTPLWAQPGFHYLMFTLIVISSSDIAAYYVGRAFGKNLLYPAISPKKTREGALGGFLVGIGAGLLCSLAWPEIPMLHAGILSALLVIVGQLGDLTESLMKRDVGMKDSGVLLASHGGILDRIDSYVFSGIVCYYYIHWVVLQQGLALEVRHWLQTGL